MNRQLTNSGTSLLIIDYTVSLKLELLLKFATYFNENANETVLVHLDGHAAGRFVFRPPGLL